jgi:hypothetical protein
MADGNGSKAAGISSLVILRTPNTARRTKNLRSFAALRMTGEKRIGDTGICRREDTKDEVMKSRGLEVRRTEKDSR